MAVIILLLGVSVALLGNVLLRQQLQQVAGAAPRIGSPERCGAGQGAGQGTMSVIIPAYNEAANIEACVQSVLQSTNWGSDRLAVWVVDDQSEDDTYDRVQALQTTLPDARLHLLRGQPRPVEQRWLGKNWACHQGSQQATGEYLLFLDADVRLQPGALETAIAAVHDHKIDLLTGVLTLACECFAEWLAQPLITGFIFAGLPFHRVNDPTCDTVVAAGSFMLFRRSAYTKIGGHQAVADQVVEDVELARLIQHQGLTLYYAIAHSLGTLRMYPTTAALWEGWTKNWYLGSQRNLPVMLAGALVIFWLCTVPLLGLISFALLGVWAGWGWPVSIGLAIALSSLLLHYPLRRAIYTLAAIPPRYWWLTSISGIFVTTLLLASIIKTETGWGWTWRGRPLQLPEQRR